MNKRIRIRILQISLAGLMCFITFCDTEVPVELTDCTPVLITPQSNQVMDNGCYNVDNAISWYFEWTNCSDATKYRIYVKHPSVPSAIIDKETSDTFYSFSTVSNTELTSGWTWKVKAFIGGTWREWSEIRTFNLEPVGTDCGG